MRQLLAPLAVLALAGCVVEHRVEPVPASAWRAAADSPRTSQPTRVVRRDPARPSVSAKALSREEVLALATSRDPGDAIVEIDRHPLTFPLTKANIAWFEDRVAPPELVDYLRKRAAVDWDALSKAPPAEPQQYAPEEYADSPPPAPESTTIYVERAPSTVIYESYVPSYSTWCGPTYYRPSYCGPAYYGPTYVYGYTGTYGWGGARVSYRPRTYSTNPVVVTTPTSSTIYRGTRLAPAGLYGNNSGPAGLYPQRLVRTSTTYSGSNPVVHVTRTAR